MVIGVHRAELAFGDAVAHGLDGDRLTVFRIPQGVRQADTAPGALFYSRAEHHEIYLQLRQQIGAYPRLLVDLHRGFDATRRAADIFCRDVDFLHALAERLDAEGLHARVRLLRIVDDGDLADAHVADGFEGAARTWIPRVVWAARRPLYVGLEVYLTSEGDGDPSDRAFARQLIDLICATGDHLWQGPA
jgi:diadenosine tetraphosphatase ApaH/serine/threonine PP2A family protein phosphatase